MLWSMQQRVFMRMALSEGLSTLVRTAIYAMGALECLLPDKESCSVI